MGSCEGSVPPPEVSSILGVLGGGGGAGGGNKGEGLSLPETDRQVAEKLRSTKALLGLAHMNINKYLHFGPKIDILTILMGWLFI